MAKSRKTKPTPEDIFNWLNTCVSEVEADGYQQSEDSKERWRTAGPPELASWDGSRGFATLEGEVFVIKIRRLPRARGTVARGKNLHIGT